MTAPEAELAHQHEPAEAVIDSHVHVWDPTRAHYPWLAEAPSLNRRFDLSDVEPEHDSAGVVAVVLVQAADDLDDTRLMLEIAASNPRVAGVVGWVPLLDPIAAARALDRWCDEPIVGVRHLIHRDPDPDLLADRRIDDVLMMLAERHLTFDVCAETEHLLRLVPALAERHPSLTLVIDHLAKPPIATGGWQPWAALLTDAAAAPNTVVKLSGLNTAPHPVPPPPPTGATSTTRSTCSAPSARCTVATGHSPCSLQIHTPRSGRTYAAASTISTTPTDTPCWPAPHNARIGWWFRR